ncbi:FAD-dependent oxidoreductase [Paradesulfitobacterium aromaticivorans]
MVKKYIIIGGSIAGLAAITALRSSDPSGEITMISEENYLPYSKVLLTHWIAGHVREENLYLISKDFFREQRVTALFGKKAVLLDPDQRIVKLDDDSVLVYDHLLIASGGRPTIPSGIPVGTAGITGLRTLEDARYIMAQARAGAPVVIFGGGLVGVKLACALREAGYAAHMIVSSPTVLSQAADLEAGKLISERMLANGIEISTQTDLERVICGPHGVAEIILTDGRTIPCQMLVAAKGVKPNLDFLPPQVAAEQGLPVDSRMRTEMPNVWAAGDVAATYEITRREYRTVAIWPHAVEQGRVAGRNMAGWVRHSRGSLARNALEILGLPYISMGIVRPSSQGDWDVESQSGKNTYRKLVYRGGKLVGAVLLGRVDEAGVLQARIRRDNPVPWIEKVSPHVYEN